MPGKRENRRPNPRPAPTFAIRIEYFQQLDVVFMVKTNRKCFTIFAILGGMTQISLMVSEKGEAVCRVFKFMRGIPIIMVDFIRHTLNFQQT